MKNVDNPFQAVSAEVTTQTDVLASRNLTTAYQNTGNKPMFVSVCVNVAAGNALSAVCDANASPTTVVAFQENQSITLTQKLTIFFIVLPNYYYKIFSSTGTKTYWIEYT